MKNRKRHLKHFTALLLIVFGMICLIVITHKFDTPKRIPYVDLEIEYDDQSQTNIRDHALKVSGGKFLLAANNPNDLQLALRFLSKRDVSFSIKSLYPDWICQKKGIDQAYLSLSSNHFSKRWQLVAGNTITLDTIVHDNDAMRVSIQNDSNRKCGRAEINMREKVILPLISQL